MSWKRIRKEAGEITCEDLLVFPSWESCLDEEHVEGQTECTMRPFKLKAETLSLDDYCLVAAHFSFPNNARHIGWIELSAVEPEEVLIPQNLDPEIFLARDTPAQIRGVGEFDLISRCEGAMRIRFCLPLTRVIDDQTANDLADNVATTLNMERHQLFPINVSPLQPIHGWPKLMQLDRFYRPLDDDKPYRRFGEIDAPDCPHCGQQLRTKLAKQCFGCGESWH